MRLAFIKKRFSLHGGAERYLQTLLREFKKAGHEIHIFANQWEKEEGLIFHKVQTISFLSYLSVLSFNRNVTSALKGNFNCIISLERTTCQDIYRAGDGCHAEWLQIRSETEPFYRRLSFEVNPLHRLLLGLEKKLFSETKRIIANSQMVKRNILHHYDLPDNKIRIIYNGVDLKRFSPALRERWRHEKRSSFKLSDNAIVLLFVGSGFRRKGLKTLVEAVSLLRDKDIKLVVVGKGSTAEYERLSVMHRIRDKIIFAGPQKEIEHFYAAADIFILPTLYDPFSNASLEAMASGLPVITTRNNGAAELIEDGVEGYVLDTLSDAAELADKIVRSLDSLELMGAGARKKAEAFSVEKAVDSFTEEILSMEKQDAT